MFLLFQIVNFKVAVLGGSSAETHAQKGSAHFLAANAYNGNGDFSGIRTVHFFEENGAKFSASADREKVRIYPLWMRRFYFIWLLSGCL